MAFRKMPPKARAKKTKAETVAPVVPAPVVEPEPVVVVPEPVAVVPEPAPAPVPVAVVPEPAPVPAPVAVSTAPDATKKKGKKQPKIVATVTPDGIQGSFLPEPRRPLIAHLQINTSEVQFNENYSFYVATARGQPEPYDAHADDYFGEHNAEIKVDATKEKVVSETEEIVIPEVIEQPKPESKVAAVSLEAFTKCDLMVEYKELKSTKKIPDTTNIACFWCAHSFTWQPSIIPEREEKGVYRVYGNFCCPNCCMAYLLHENIDTHVRWERIALLHRLYGKHYNSGRIFPSPARESLKLFGGSVPIEQYRATVAEGKVRVDIQMPPMVSILGSIDTKPIDFYDSSMKHTISPLLGELVPKAEEGLRLKRSKPLKEKDSTLDSVLKIAIKSKK